MVKRHKIALAIMVSIIFGILSFYDNAYAVISDWQKGVNITPKSSTDFSSNSFKQSLDSLTTTGVNHVTYVIYYYQPNIHSSDIRSGYNTPSDSSLVEAIRYAKSLGLDVTLKVHIDSQDGRWRGSIDPDNRSEWFANYKNILMKYARIASANDVDQMVVGTELVHLSSSTYDSLNSTGWNDVISSIKSVFGGTLTYSAQWSGYGPSDALDEKQAIGFWDQLDYIGVSAYYPLAENSSNPTVEELMESWRDIDENELRKLAQDNQLDLLFTEIGFRSVSETNQETWNYWKDGSYDPDLQSRLFEALFRYWKDKDYFKGIHIWEWETDPSAGGNGNESYTPQNKPAENVIASFFKNSDVEGPTPAPNPNPTTPNNPPEGTSYSVSGTALPSSLNINQSTSVTYKITSTNNLNGVIINMEVYDFAGKRVFQKYLVNQSFSSDSPVSYNIQFVPKDPGEYTAKLGIFSNNWETLYYWNNKVTSVKATSPEPIPSLPTKYTLSGSANSQNPAVNETVNLTANASTDKQIGNVIVDVEILNNDGKKIFQKYYTAQTLNELAKQYQTTWTPKEPGTYTLHVGVFNNDWTQKYQWASAVSLITVDVNSSDNDEEPEVEIEIWWPEKDVKISGTQPFKAVLNGKSLNDYDMYWQVDNESQHKMESKGSHKEDILDINDWEDKDDNPYTVKFIAKDKNGETLAEKSVRVYTWIK